MRILRRGDTLVEVLFAIAIIGLVLAAAYSTASQSLKTSRKTQERTEALKIAEGQLEAMKSLTGTPRDQLFTQTNFCIAPAGPTILPAGDAGCRLRFYTALINRNSAGGRDFFTITVSWTPPGGSDSNPAVVSITYGYPR